MEVFHMLFERCHTKDRKGSLKQHIKYFNFWSKTQLDHHVGTCYQKIYTSDKSSCVTLSRFPCSCGCGGWTICWFWRCQCGGNEQEEVKDNRLHGHFWSDYNRASFIPCYLINAMWPFDVQSSPLIWSTDVRSTRLYGQFLAGPNHRTLILIVTRM